MKKGGRAAGEKISTESRSREIVWREGDLASREERTTVVCAESCSQSETFAVWTKANDAPRP